MCRKTFFLLLILFTPLGYAQEYTFRAEKEGIHETTITSTWCFNLTVTTKLGKKDAAGQCQYLKETPAFGFDGCRTLYLNAGLLATNAGLGFDCAATHVRSAAGNEALDAFALITDAQGHYIDTVNPTGKITL